MGQDMATLDTLIQNRVDAADNEGVDVFEAVIALRPFLTVEAWNYAADVMGMCAIHECDVEICADDDDESCLRGDKRATTSGDGHSLYERNTWAPNDRLNGLRSGDVALSEHDVTDLYATFVQGSADVGVDPTLVEFGQWLSGTGNFDGAAPAEVQW